MTRRGRTIFTLQPDEASEPDFDPGHSSSLALRRSSTSCMTSRSISSQEAISSISCGTPGAHWPDNQFSAARGVLEAMSASFCAANRNGAKWLRITFSSRGRGSNEAVAPLIPLTFRNFPQEFGIQMLHVPSCERRNWRNWIWRNMNEEMLTEHARETEPPSSRGCS